MVDGARGRGSIFLLPFARLKESLNRGSSFPLQGCQHPSGRGGRSNHHVGFTEVSTVVCAIGNKKEKQPQSLEVIYSRERLFHLLFLLKGHASTAGHRSLKSEFPRAAAPRAPLPADPPGYPLLLQLACHSRLQRLANGEYRCSLRLPLKADVSTSPPHKLLRPRQHFCTHGLIAGVGMEQRVSIFFSVRQQWNKMKAEKDV